MTETAIHTVATVAFAENAPNIRRAREDFGSMLEMDYTGKLDDMIFFERYPASHVGLTEEQNTEREKSFLEVKLAEFRRVHGHKIQSITIGVTRFYQVALIEV